MFFYYWSVRGTVWTNTRWILIIFWSVIVCTINFILQIFYSNEQYLNKISFKTNPKTYWQWVRGTPSLYVGGGECLLSLSHWLSTLGARSLLRSYLETLYNPSPLLHFVFSWNTNLKERMKMRSNHYYWYLQTVVSLIME